MRPTNQMLSLCVVVGEDGKGAARSRGDGRSSHRVERRGAGSAGSAEGTGGRRNSSNVMIVSRK